jgi:YVTN family beta-propeller protein
VTISDRVVRALAFDRDTLLVADADLPLRQGGALIRVEGYGGPSIVSRIELPRTPAALAAGDGYAWIADEGRTVLRVDLETEQVSEIRVGARPTAIAFGEGSVGVVNGSDGKGSRRTPNPLGVAATIGVGRDPTAIAVGEDAVWVANGLDGTVSRIDPETNEVVATIEVGHRPEGIAVGGGLVWVTVRS